MFRLLSKVVKLESLDSMKCLKKITITFKKATCTTFEIVIGLANKVYNATKHECEIYVTNVARLEEVIVQLQR